jgi:hypothetical protein
MDEKDFFSKLDKLRKRLNKYTDDKIVVIAKKSGIQKFIPKLVKYADEYNELRRSYRGDISYNTDELATSISNRIGDMDRLVGELLQQSPLQKKTPPPIPKKSKEVKQKYEELMKKPIVLREGKKEKSPDFETIQKKAVKGLKDWEQGLSSADRARIEARIAEVMAKAKAKKAPTKGPTKPLPKPPTKAPAKAPAKPLTKAPVKGPTKPLPKPPTKALTIEAQAEKLANEWFKAWIKGSIKSLPEELSKMLTSESSETRGKKLIDIFAKREVKDLIDKRKKNDFIQAWGNLDPNLAVIFSQYNPKQFAELEDAFSQIKEGRFSNNTITDHFIMGFFHDYTDEIYEKYGADALFGGANIIVNSIINSNKKFKDMKYISYYMEDPDSYPSVLTTFKKQNNRIKLDIELRKKAIEKEALEEEKNKPPAKTPTKTPTKGPKSNREIIIEAWGEGDPVLNYVLQQQNPKLYEDAYNWVKKRKGAIIDTGALFLFKDYIDEIFERYGADALFEGENAILEQIIDDANNDDDREREYLSTYFHRAPDSFPIKKGLMKEKNRQAIFKKKKRDLYGIFTEMQSAYRSGNKGRYNELNNKYKNEINRFNKDWIEMLKKNK